MATNKLNYGEWGELYVLLRLVGDGKLNLTDENEKEVLGYYLDLIEVIRHETAERTVRYRKGKHIDDVWQVLIFVNDDNMTSAFNDEFSDKADELLDYVKEGRRAPFPVPESLGKFFAAIEVQHYKAKSSDKSDIFLSAGDPRSGLVRENIGYSVKTKWSRKSTLFNTGNGSRSVYRLHGRITDKLIDEVNSLVNSDGDADVIGRWKMLDEAGVEREFQDYAYCSRAKCHAFSENLELMNPYSINMFEQIVRARFENRLTGVSIAEVNDWLVSKNPCALRRPEIQYEYMLKNFLYASYCGMTASTPWDGRSNVNGGLITVQPDGRIVAFNALDGEVFKSYLFHHCCFDWPSTAPAHGNYGKIYYTGDLGWCFDLNFQVRFQSF